MKERVNMKALIKKTMDGNTATAHASYAFTEVAAIFPITPSSTMAEMMDEWSATGRKNIFGKTVDIREMQSEGGASGVVHGSLQGGALTSTYTAAQGLMLMIPNMYKIAGELLPAVFHVAARGVAANALSIFGDHSDVMAIRQTGFCMLASSNVQDCFYMASVAHLAAIKGRLPFVHFFDGFRTSHEYQNIDVLDYEDLKELVDWDAVKAFRDNSLNPNHPHTRGVAENPDIYFQHREAVNKFYPPMPGIVQDYMDKINEMAGTNYKLFNYYGAEDADKVIVSMGSSCDTIKETIDFWNKKGMKLGLVEVHLFRPFSIDNFLAAFPKTVKKVAVLDRTKEPGSAGEPLYLDVVDAFSRRPGEKPLIVGGRYGLGSKEFTPNNVMSVYANLDAAEPKNQFTVGIIDDVTNKSLPPYEDFDSTPEGIVCFKFWGLGSDGTVSANKSAAKIIGDHTNFNIQAYFAYDSKKSGGLTVSHLRMGEPVIRSTYQIDKANFIACHNQAYVQKYDMADDLKDGGIFLLNTQWTPEELEKELPGHMKRMLATKHAQFYTLDAVDLAREIGLGGRINMIMQAAFFKLTEVLPVDDAIRYLKEEAEHSYGKNGRKVVEMNWAAIDKGVGEIKKIEVPASWADCKDDVKEFAPETPDWIKNVYTEMAAQRGNKLPVSTFNGREDGSFPMGVTAWEKRGVSVEVPTWDIDKCIQCNLCSYSCPHAVVRPVLLDEAEAAAAPANYPMKDATGHPGMKFHLTISALDCTGCGVCVNTCPKGALTMVPLHEVVDDSTVEFKYSMSVADKPISEKEKYTVKGSQFLRPYLQFSGACAGCGETPYAKLITQLYGRRLMVANSAGCSHIWSGSPETAYASGPDGKGPAWGCSLFEDTAEFGLGMFMGSNNVRKSVKAMAEEALKTADGELKEALQAWLDGFEEGEGSVERGDALEAALLKAKGSDDLLNRLYDRRDYFLKPSQWIIGGDGWAYDIDYGGLDHVLASGENVNVLCVDTEVYSNTGGQSSKATPTAAIAKFAASGKKTKKKDLGMLAVSYGYIYVAQVALGADRNQTLKAIREAESYNGPSLVICYAPCINHGIKVGMGHSQDHTKDAVDAGYWAMWRWDPRKVGTGENPFTLDSKKPTKDLREFLESEVRYKSLLQKFPDQAEQLLQKAVKDMGDRNESYFKMAGLE